MQSLSEEEDIPSQSMKHQACFSKYKIRIVGAVGLVLLVVTFFLMSNITIQWGVKEDIKEDVKESPKEEVKEIVKENVQCEKKKYEKTVLFYPTLDLPIHFIWIGQDPLPQKYAQRLKMLKYPYKLLGNKQQAKFKDFFNFSSDISIGKRSDAFKLAYIWKYGGIYSDLDNVIIHQGVMMKLQGKQGTYYALQQGQGRVPTINFFYSSKPGDPIIEEVIKVAHQRQSYPTLHFLFGYMQKKYMKEMKTIDFDSCVYHEFDAS